MNTAKTAKKKVIKWKINNSKVLKSNQILSQLKRQQKESTALINSPNRFTPSPRTASDHSRRIVSRLKFRIGSASSSKSKNQLLNVENDVTLTSRDSQQQQQFSSKPPKMTKTPILKKKTENTSQLKNSRNQLQNYQNQQFRSTEKLKRPSSGAKSTSELL